MNKEVDLSKYQIRTDLTIEELENNSKLKGRSLASLRMTGRGRMTERSRMTKGREG